MKNNLNTVIYIVTHKQIPLPEKIGYIPIVVGKNNVTYPICVRDDTGENISEKNANYCELTALYWMWKNEKQNKNLGLCHYRRFFTNSICSKEPVSVKKIEKLLKNYDIIMPHPWAWFDCTVQEWFLSTNGKQKDLDNLRMIVKKIYPNYLKEYDEVMNGYEASYLNMFVMSYELLDKYCDWLFTILFELEKVTNLTGYTSTEARIFGFLSERLFNVWIKKNRLKVKYLHVYEQDKGLYIKFKLKNRLKHIILNKEQLQFLRQGKWGRMYK